MLVKRSMSGHSFLKPWWMNPGLESMCHYPVWTLAKKTKDKTNKKLSLSTATAGLKQSSDAELPVFKDLI